MSEKKLTTIVVSESDKDIDKNPILNPDYYGGKENAYEVMKVIYSWGLCFKLGNAIKYIARAGKKDKTKTIEDLKKAIVYLERKIEEVSTGKINNDEIKFNRKNL